MLTQQDEIEPLPTALLQQRIIELQTKQLTLEAENRSLLSRVDFYEQIHERSPVACLTLNSNGIVNDTNRSAANLLGYRKSEIVNHSFAGFIHCNDKTAFETLLSAVLNSQKPQSLTCKLRRSDGRFIDAECRSSAIVTPDTHAHFCLVLNDVTDQNEAQFKQTQTIKQLEENIRNKTAHLTESNLTLIKTIEELNHSRHQLLEREAKLNSILNASIEGIIVIDTSGTIVSINAAVEKIFGFSAEELIGFSVNLLMPINMRKKQDYYLKKYLRIFVPQVIGQIREVEGLRKDGALVPLDMTIAEFPLDGMHYYSGIVRDVSARKQQELQEKDHLEKLAHVTRLGLMGEMASGIAHEVNQPLSAVVNYTQVCLRYIQNENPDLSKIAETLNKANQQALKAGQIIHSMREFVKPRKIHRSTVDINELIYDAISIFEPDFKQHLIVMRFELTKNLPSVFIDRVQIEQVILNLIRNSIDALKELPQFTQRQLSIETSLNHLNYIVVRVKDNGPGLSPVQREKILTPFFTTKASGMGMGLSISRSLVEAHQGTLHFNSKEDKGTTFYFTLPTEKTNHDRNAT